MQDILQKTPLLLPPQPYTSSALAVSACIFFYSLSVHVKIEVHLYQRVLWAAAAEMRSPSHSPDDSSQKAIEGDLVETGEKLLAIPSSTDELLILLEKAESLLAKVWQRPPVSTCFALLPAMKALITDEILRHYDVNVQVAVASCFNELTRITCPDPPYDDDVMMVFFRLFMIAFKQLSCESGQNYSRALLIIETMAKVRSFLMLLDIDTEGQIIVEMFQLFLSNVKSNHLSDVFKYMEMIMTSVIEESDEISSELLRPLLTSVKMENKNTSPISWKLGKKVFENCATKLPSYLREAVKEMNLVLADYAVIVTSICHFISHDKSNGKNMVSNKVPPTVGARVSQLDGLPEAVHEYCDPQTNDGNGTKSNDENSLEMLKGRQSGTDSGALRRRRGRKPNSVIRPEEGYQHVWTKGIKYSGEVSSDGYNDEKDDSGLVSEKGNASNLSDYSKKEKNYSSINQPNDLKFSSTLKMKIMQTKVKERDYDASMKTGKKAIGESSNVMVKKGKGIIGDTDKGGEYELLSDEKQERKKIISQKHAHKDVVDKMEEFPMVKAKSLRKDKEMKSRRSRVAYGEKLVNLRIQVWWPMDEMFYAGIVTAFDPETKKHTILYDDDETEILNLRKERWELCAGEQPPLREEADHPSPAQQSVILKKTTKQRAVSSKPQHAASSPKRLKSENRSAIKYVENSELDFALANDESDTEACETNVTPEDDGDNHEDSETLLEKMKSGHIPEDVTKG